MIKYFKDSKKNTNAANILIISLMFLSACSLGPVFPKDPEVNSKENIKEPDKDKPSDKPSKDESNEAQEKPDKEESSDKDKDKDKEGAASEKKVEKVKIVEPPYLGESDASGILALSIRVNPARPQNEVYLGEWRIRIFGLDDEGRKNSSTFYAMSSWQGNIIIELPPVMFRYPLLISAFNDVMPFEGCTEKQLADRGECPQYEIFIPPYCFDKAIWLLGPVENAVWNYYRDAAMRHGEGWNTSQVDCSSWIESLMVLNSTHSILDELQRLSLTEFRRFPQEVLIEALQDNQDLLVPTGPPICMAARRHDGGGMGSGESVELPIILDEIKSPVIQGFRDFDPIKIGANAVVKNICKIPLTGSLSVNSSVFTPQQSNRLQDKSFIGVVSNEKNTTPGIDVSVFNTKLGNGRSLDSDIYDDACALTSVIQFTNTNSDEISLLANTTGVTFTNLFGDGSNTEIFLTSDGDCIVDDSDFWVIFFKSGAEDCKEQVLAVELLGHRREALRDDLHMSYETDSEDLFLGLRADYELNDGHEGEMAFLSYTVHIWDGSLSDSVRKLRRQFAACYLAADKWALPFFRLRDLELRGDGVDVNIGNFCPLELAEFAVRSQCFSNSRSNQRWQNEIAGIWSINSIKNVTGNIFINPGWLGPNLDFDIYVQRFNEAFFTGPVASRTTDKVGQMMVELPTLVEGDRVLIRNSESFWEDSEDEYKLVLPCVPEFTGFSVPPGITYLDPTRNLPSLLPLPMPGPPK